MPAANNHPSDEKSQPDYSRLDRPKERSTTPKPHGRPASGTNTQQSAAPTAPTALPPLPTKPACEQDSGTQKQSENRSAAAATQAATATTRPLPSRQDSKHTGERGPREDSSDTHSDATINTTTTNIPANSADHHQKAPSGLSNTGVTSEMDSSDSMDYEPRDQEQDVIQTVKMGRPSGSVNRVSLKSGNQSSYAQHANSNSKDYHRPQGATEEDTSARGNAPHLLTKRSKDNRAPPGHHPEDEHQNRTSESQGSGYTQWISSSISNFIMPGGSPLGDTYQNQYYRVKNELKQSHTAYERNMRQANHMIGNLQHENQRLNDNNSSLQNELFNVRQQLEDAKNLSEVRGKELVGSQVFLTKADTLSISEIGERVTALNEEIFQAAAALADALIHKRHEVSQTALEVAAAVSQEMVGEKMTKLLIDQSQKPEPEVNPLLVQVVFQIYMVKFCVSKIQSWYPDPAIGEFLSAIYSQIRSSEEQAVSGRWRALTRANTRPTTEKWMEELYEKLQFVMTTASWTPRSSENEKSFANRLPSIFKAVNELRLAIGEKFTSADLDIFAFECDHIYDPTIMEDAYGDDRKSSGGPGKRTLEPIVGTTGIGLMKLMATERTSVKDAHQFQSLVPAKIVLTSTVNEALEPIQSTRSKKRKIKPPVENLNAEVQVANRESRETRESKAGA